MQENNYKRINTENLLENFKVDLDNLVIIEGSLRLENNYVYKFNKVIFDDDNFDISDIAVDECDLIYMVDQKRNSIFTYEKKTDALRKTGCKPGTLPLDLDTPSGIGIDKDTIYVADKGNQRLVALARSNLQIRWVISKGPDEEPFNEIVDLAVDLKGNIYVLEVEEEEESALEEGMKRILKISRKGSISGVISSDVLSQPTDIALDEDGNIYVLDKKAVHKFGVDGKLIDTVSVKGFSPKGLSVDANKHIFIGESDSKVPTIHRQESGDNFTPLWSYRGATRKLINDSKGNLYVINDKGSKLTFLSYDKVNVPNKEDSFKGTYISKPIDSHIPETQWHRFVLEGDFKKGTQVEFSYYISDELLTDDEIKNIKPEEWYKGISGASAIQGEKRRDALFLEDVRGRYLWFKIILTGTETLSPVVKEITIFFPRTSYLGYLPAIYQEDPVSRGFLERFLAIFESIFFEIGFSIDHINRLFDPSGTPSEFLSWLGSWLALSMDEDWPEDKKRLFIQNAISLYKKRGTKEGLEESIELYTGQKPIIVENFRIDNLTEDTGQKPLIREKLPVEFQSHEKKDEMSQIGDTIFFPPKDAKIKPCNSKIEESNTEELPLAKILFGTERFCFCVFLEYQKPDERTMSLVKRIIEEQKPAHTCYGLKLLEPWFYLDMHTYLGINTKLTRPEFILGKTSVVGRDTVLHDVEQAGQVERHSRIEIDTKLS